MNKQLAIYIYNKRTAVDWLRAFGDYFFQQWFSLYAVLRSQYRMVLFLTGCCFVMCCYADECIAMNTDEKTDPSQQPLCRDVFGTSGGQGACADRGSNPPSSPPPPPDERIYETINLNSPHPSPASSSENLSENSQYGCVIPCHKPCNKEECIIPVPKCCTEDRLGCGSTCGLLCGPCCFYGTLLGTSAPVVGFGYLGNTLGVTVGSTVGSAVGGSICCCALGCGIGCGIGFLCGERCGQPFLSCMCCECLDCKKYSLNCKKHSSKNTEEIMESPEPSAPIYQQLYGNVGGGNPIYQNTSNNPPITTQPMGFPGGGAGGPISQPNSSEEEFEHLLSGDPEKQGGPGDLGHRSLPPTPVTTQPTSGGPIHTSRKVDLLSGYHPGAHVSSLLGMQHVLVTTSEQVLTTLKALALRAYETTTGTTHAAQQHFVGGSALRKRLGTSCASMSALQGMQSFRPYTFFGGTDQYRSNLENKVRSGMAGLMLNPTSRLSVGVSYNRHYDEGQEQQGMRVGLSTGSAKAKTILDGLSMVVAWNTEAAGFTGHVASCCGWGNAKTTRNVVHGGKDVASKGRPDVSLRGGAAQFGYNVQSKYVSFTPYIECLVSRVAWDPYTEVSGKLPCAISRNKEQIVEQNIGLRKSWKMNETAAVQVWVAEVFGRRKTNTLTSRPSLAPLSRYEVSVPMHKRRYIRTEFGTSYRAQVTEVFMLNVDGRFRRSTKGTLDDHNMSLNLHYSY